MMTDTDKNEDMVFGFDRQTDERSLRIFLGRIARQNLLKELVPRLSSEEIETVVDLFTGLMKSHLTKNEYHRLFLDKQ